MDPSNNIMAVLIIQNLQYTGEGGSKDMKKEEKLMA